MPPSPEKRSGFGRLVLVWLLLTLSAGFLLALWRLLPSVEARIRGVPAKDAVVLPKAPLEVARTVTPRGDLAGEERTNIDLFENARDSVVYITTAELVRDGWTRNVLAVPRGSGSGFMWDGAGHVITNFHVIQGAAQATVKLADGRGFPAKLVGASPSHDIAVLRVEIGEERPAALPVGTSGDLRVGQKVFAIGNPFGLDWTLTTGIVSALDRSLPNEAQNTSIEHLIQTDAAINPGNSGGPLLDSSGRLIGMNTAIFSPSGASAGIGFAVPVDTIARVVPQLIATGKYVRPALGIEIDEGVNQHLRRQLGVSGVFVLRVRPGSPAEKAGLVGAELTRSGIVPGDVIVALDGKPIDGVPRLTARLDDYRAGDRVEIEVLREQKTRKLELQLAPGN